MVRNDQGQNLPVTIVEMGSGTTYATLEVHITMEDIFIVSLYQI